MNRLPMDIFDFTITKMTKWSRLIPYTWLKLSITDNVGLTPKGQSSKVRLNFGKDYVLNLNVEQPREMIVGMNLVMHLFMMKQVLDKARVRPLSVQHCLLHFSRLFGF